MFIRPRIIPVLLIDQRDLVKTRQFKNPTYLGDPVNAVKIFNIKDVDEMAILDISATRLNAEPDFELLEDIASQAFMPLSYGGGIKTIEQAKKLLSLGYEKVVFNTMLVKDASVIEGAVRFFGGQSVVASIDVKRVNGEYRSVIEGGRQVLEKHPLELAQKAEALGVGEIFLNSVDCDGMMGGYDLDLVEQISESVSIPVTACGGARSITDLKDVIDWGGAHAAAAGSMFVFYGRLRAVLITFPTEQELSEAEIYISNKDKNENITD